MRKRLLIILAAAALSLSQCPSLGADSFTGLDLVVLIDQSGSMWGSPAVKGRMNDRYNHRIGICQNILMRLAEHVRGSGVVHRVSVIDFGTKVKTAFSNLRLAHNPADPGEVMRTAVSTATSAIRPRPLSNTNTSGAMALAHIEFSRMGGASPQTGRRRICLIITDGRPTLGKLAGRVEMRKRVAKQASRLKRLGVEIWVLGIDAEDNYWNAGDGKFWKDLIGEDRARLAAHPSINLASVMQDIFSNWLGVGYRPLKGGSYHCPPYLGRLVFDINFATKKSPTRIITPTGKPVTPSLGGDIDKPGTFMRFEIKEPAAGAYHLDPLTLAGRTVSVEHHPLKVERLSPLGSVSPSRKTGIRFRVVDSQGGPLKPLAAWPLKANVIVDRLEGPTRRVELPANFLGRGVFEAFWTPEKMGKHRLSLQGLVAMCGGKTIDVFKGSSLKGSPPLTVKKPPPYKLLLIQPSIKGLTVYPWQSHTAAELVLTGFSGKRLTRPPAALGNPDNLLQIQALDSSGAALSQPLPLKHGLDGVFGAALPLTLDIFTGQGWLRPGGLCFKVLPGKGGKHHFDMIHSLTLPGGAAQRINGDPYSAGPVELWLPLPMLLAIIILPVLAVAGLAAYLFMVFLPNFRIRRQDRGQGLSLVVFDSINDPLAAQGIRLSLSSHRTRLDRRLKLDVNGDTHIATRLRVVRVHTGGKPEAIIINAWDKDKKSRQDQIRLDQGRRISGLKGNHNYYFKLEAA